MTNRWGAVTLALLIVGCTSAGDSITGPTRLTVEPVVVTTTTEAPPVFEAPPRMEPPASTSSSMLAVLIEPSSTEPVAEVELVPELVGWFDLIAVLDERLPDWRERLPGWEMAYKPGQPGLLGMTFTEERRIEIYARPDRTMEQTLHIVGHELGHAFDVTYGTCAMREVWMTMRGLAGGCGAWWPDVADDRDSPAGDWAEAFAWWLFGVSFESRMAGLPTQAQTDAMATMLGLP
jgi:hypothetical protein